MESTTGLRDHKKGAGSDEAACPVEGLPAGVVGGADRRAEGGYAAEYRPFTASGPVQEVPDEFRAVTVFELADLVERANDRTKEVILMARQCGLCGSAHAGALRARLCNTNLKVSSRLVLDRINAVTLLK